MAVTAACRFGRALLMTEVLFSFGPYLIITVSANGQTRARALGCKSVEAKTNEANLHTEKPSQSKELRQGM